MNKPSGSYKVFLILNNVILFLVILSTLYPIAYVFALSFSDNAAILGGKVSVYPVNFNLNAYIVILKHHMFWIGYKNTFVYTLVSTIIGLTLTIMCAYPLSKKNLKGKNFFTGLIVFTMFFGGGLIPNYLLIKNLRMIDTIWAVTVPGVISVWNMVIMRTFFQGIPDSLEEAASIDGMNPIGILINIILPLSKPILATIGLFIAVREWNSWFGALIYLNTNNKFPVMLYLRNIVSSGSQLSSSDSGNELGQSIRDSSEAMKSATIILVALPIILIYPFIQKYFVKGMMVGSIKG